MELNELQQKAYDLCLADKPRVVAILGNAGSGKSFLISELAKVLKDCFITATTNKAKSLLESKIGKKCYTTHSIAGFVMTRSGISEYLSQVREPLVSDIIIIDEFSMLTQNVLNAILNAPYRKIILVGDLSQLPAIGIKASIPSNASVITLIENMRQVDNPEVQEWLESLRHSIASRKLYKLSENLPNGIIAYDDHKAFCIAYLASNRHKRILAYSNKVVDNYNANINKAKFNIGDMLVIDKPLGNARNGDIVEITSLDEYPDYYSMLVCFEYNTYSIKVYKTKSALEKHLSKYKTPEAYWQEMDTIYHPKQIYASTVHKAQGMTIEEVFVDVRDIYQQLFRVPSKYNHYNKPISLEEYLRLIYVAISRMSYKAHLFIGEKRDYKILKKGLK